MGCVGQSYGKTNVFEKGIVIISLSGGITAVTNILTEVSSMPVKHIYRLEKDFAAINASSDNTVCIDFCSSNDEFVLTTIESVIHKRNIPLTGGTAWEGLVCCNGKVYEDACVYGLVHSNSGKVKVYKENLYLPTDKKYLVTKSIPKENTICELDGHPAATVYADALHIKPEQMTEQTFINPLGRIILDNVFIISIKEYFNNNTMACFRKVNPKDSICILQMGDYEQIVQDTKLQIQRDFQHISGIISINCLFRYLFFQEHNYADTYFNTMSKLAPHAGLIGLGEHYNGQHTNQTMSCVVFE